MTENHRRKDEHIYRIKICNRKVGALHSMYVMFLNPVIND